MKKSPLREIFQQAEPFRKNGIFENTFFTEEIMHILTVSIIHTYLLFDNR